MSVKIEFKGIVEKMFSPVRTKSNKFIQKTVVRQPAFVDEYGDKIGEDNYYELVSFKDKESDFLKPMSWLKKKVKVTAYLNGRENLGSNEIFYNLSLVLKDLEEYKNGRGE